MSNKIYELFSAILRPASFASWARPKTSDLNIPRKRFLNDNNEVVWNIGDESCACADHIEMAGFYASSIISYGKDNRGKLRLMKHLVVPTLRVQPNVTQSSFSYNFGASPAVIKVNHRFVSEYPKEIKLKAI